MTLWLDCDGVLADFDKVANDYLSMDSREFEKQFGSEAFWAKLGEIEDFYFSLPLLPDALILYEAVKHLDPIILTGVPSQHGTLAHVQKIRWAHKHFGTGQLVVTCKSKLKYRFCKPGDVIVDDWPQHRKKWEEAGGIWIPHKSAEDSIAQMKELGIL